jgi:hypothetical protein
MRIELRTDEQVARLQSALEDLGDAMVCGDLRPGHYVRRRQDLVAELGRSRVGCWLEPGEAIVAEHHWVEPTVTLSASALNEPVQLARSAYATSRRVFRWRFREVVQPGMPARETDESLEYERYAAIAAFADECVTRWGEVAVGAAIALVALLLRGHLQLSITGPVLLGVGIFGVIHGLLCPTRYTTITPSDSAQPKWEIWAADTKSGRRLLEEVRCRVRPASENLTTQVVQAVPTLEPPEPLEPVRL